MNARDFWRRVDVRGPDECWEYRGVRNHSGYGRIFNSRYPADGPRMFRAHRLAYEFHYGEAPGELSVLHRCDNPPCCNPAHLRLGTQADNVRDRESRGRRQAIKGEANPRSKLTEENVREIKRRFNPDRRGDVPQAAREFGVSSTKIAQILRGKAWRHVV